jgi:type VI secretion system protein ImpL
VFKIAVKVGVPVGLALILVWAIKEFVSLKAAQQVGLILIGLVLLVFLIWLLLWFGRKIFSLASAARARREMERAAAPSSAIRPEEQASLEGLQRNLSAALKVIRESKVARRHKASEALYAFPWILLLGPAGSGKTTALQECGVEFPYITGEGRKPKKGRTGDECDYWFSRDAIVLDLAGRIAVDEEDLEVFRGFLNQLKRARRERPVDGVVVTVSVREILDQSVEEIELLAGRLRQRLEEMIKHLGIRFPVYILFTKCDQIDGFAEFFKSFRSRERAQVWGATISSDQRRQYPAEQILKSELDRMIATLSTYRLRAMASEKNPAALPKIYSFPSRFAALRKKLEEFTGALFQPTPYSERPMFRGFYFASAAGADAPAEHFAQAETGWDPNRRISTQQERPAGAKNFFLETLFPSVIFADRPLAKPSVNTRLQRRLWLDVAFVALLAICTILLAGTLYSFLGNRALIKSTRDVAQQLTDAGWDGKNTSSLVAMQKLRRQLEKLDQHRMEGPPWTLRWGLYSGEEIADSSRRLYFRRLHQSFIAPTADALRRKLYSFSTGTENAANYGDFHTHLRAYLMMADPSRSEAPFLNSTLAPIWKTFAPQDAVGIALEQLSFYTQQLPKNDTGLRVTADSKIVDLARRSLNRYPRIEQVFTGLKDEGNKKFTAITLAQATGGKGLKFLTSSHDIPGVFCEAGWSKYFKDAAVLASKEAARDDWVLGPPSGNVSTGSFTDTDLRNKYFKEYVEEWRQFLDGISIRPLADLTEARAVLDSFSQQDSALLQLLGNAASNTMLRREPEKSTGLGGLVSNTMTTLGISKQVDQTQLIDAVAGQFRPLHDLVTSPDEKTPSMVAQYILALGEVQKRLEPLVDWDSLKDYIANNPSGSEFRQGYRIIDQIRKQCTTPSTQMIAPLLEKPLRETRAAITREIGNRLDGRWKDLVSDGFKRDLENGFPFNPEGQDVSLSVLSQFLKPNEGTLASFYQNELRMFLVQSPNGYTPKPLFGENEKVAFSPVFLEFLQKMYVIRQTLFPQGASEISVKFDLKPESNPALSESLLEIDGQPPLRYRNEVTVATPMTWPSKTATPQAKLSIALAGSGQRPPGKVIEGEWALFRLLWQASLEPISPNTYAVKWFLPNLSGSNVDVRYKLHSSLPNPFAPEFFKNVVCPEHACRLPEQ